jgi:hypothetical protein
MMGLAPAQGRKAVRRGRDESQVRRLHRAAVADEQNVLAADLLFGHQRLHGIPHCPPPRPAPPPVRRPAPLAA